MPTRSLWPHVAVLALVLVLAAWWTGASGRVSVDEGTAVLQGQSLAEGDGWALDHSLQDVDPHGTAFPLRSAAAVEDGFVPFGKHPAYPALLSVADSAGGVRGMVALSLVGTVVAAVAGARLAQRLDPTVEVATLYVVGLGSPLLFDSTLVIAHSLGAAAAGLAAVALVRHHEAAGDRWLSGWLGGAAVAIAAVVLLRGEGPLLLGAAGLVAGITALVTRRRSWWTTAVTVAAAGGVAVLVDRGWHRAIAGDGATLPIPTRGGSFLADRWEGLVTTMVRPSYAADGADALLVVGVALLAVAVVALRRGGDDERVGAILSALAAALVLAWSVATSAPIVPGLLVAFPVLWVGLALGGWGRDALARSLVAVAGVFALTVAATQYRQGGGLEWGARYLALALPLVIPVSVASVARSVRAVGSPVLARTVLASLVVVTATLSVGALRSKEAADSATRAVERAIVARSRPSRVGAADTDSRAIIVSTEFVIPQATWALYDDFRWLRLRDDEPVVVAGPDPRVVALVEAGVDEFTFVTRDLERDRPLLGEQVTVGRPGPEVSGFVIVRVVVT